MKKGEVTMFIGRKQELKILQRFWIILIIYKNKSRKS